MPIAAFCIALLTPLDQAKTTLTRRFVANEKLAYALRSHLTTEQRQKGLQTWLPSDVDINYNYTILAKAMQADGFAVIYYNRPTMTIIEDEGGDPKTTVQKTDWSLRMLLSPVNEMIDVKDLKPPKPEKKGKDDSDDDEGGGGMPIDAVDQNSVAVGLFGQFAGEVQRLALFIGSLDSALDLAPKLPLEAVKVGDTWKRTVDYMPQKLKGKDGSKTAIQRLDYTFTYQGIKTVNGKQVVRIEAKTGFKSDLIDYVKTIFADTGVRTIVSSLPLSLDATIQYDLDPKTHHTLAARATSEGGYGLYLKGDSDAYLEGKFKGRTDVDLVGHKFNVKS